MTLQVMLSGTGKELKLGLAELDGQICHLACNLMDLALCEKAHVLVKFFYATLIGDRDTPLAREDHTIRSTTQPPSISHVSALEVCSAHRVAQIAQGVPANLYAMFLLLWYIFVLRLCRPAAPYGHACCDDPPGLHAPKYTLQSLVASIFMAP